MKHRVLAILLSLCLLVGLFPTVALAADDTWSDVVTEKPEGYAEDAEGDVTISSAERLAWFAKQVNEGSSFAGKRVSLEEDVNLSDYEWVPIGTQENPFDGTFDGNLNKISGIKITLSESNTTAGLFGRVSNAVIEDVIVRDAEVKGTIVGEENPSTNDKRFTGVYIGGVVAGLKKMNASVENTVTIENCQVELNVNIQTKNGVSAVIGGVLGWTEDNWSGSKADIFNTDADLTVTYNADEGFYRTAIGGAIGEANGKTISSVENGIYSLKTSLSGNGFMSGGDFNKAVQIGGVVGGMPGASSSTGKLIDIKKVSCNTEADFSDTTDLLDQITTDVGGVFGRGIYYTVEGCFAQIELTGNEKPSHYGNLAGYTYNETISCNRVYTYGIRHQGTFTYENEYLSFDSNGGVMPDYPLKDVYYIEPQILTENVAGVPFQYESFHDSHEETPNINEGFLYSDGDTSDSIQVTSEDGGKTISVTPASDACDVHGEMTLDSEFKISFTLPVVVEESGTEKYTINTEVKKMSGFYASALVETVPKEEAKVGEKVVVKTESSSGVLDSLTVVTDGGKEIEAIRTDGTGDLGNQTYEFTMPDDNVTVTGTFRAKKEEITVLPSNTLDFGIAHQGYEQPEAITVTLKNTGETTVSFTLNTLDYFDVQTQTGNWNTSGKVSLKIGESATLTVRPKANLNVGTYSETIKNKWGSGPIQITLNFKVADDYEISVSPTELYFDDMELGDTSPDGKTVEITNIGKNPVTVSLPTGLKYFDISTGDDWQEGEITLASQAKTTVTVTPKIGLGLSGDDPYVEWFSFRPEIGEAVEVGAMVYVIEVTHCTITATAGMNGSIDPVGAVQVNKGDDQTFTIKPDEGYEIEDVLVNGVSVGTVNSYTFHNVQTPQAIYASFKPTAPNTFTITASAGANGTISPSGTVTVTEGDNKTFTISADSGYKIKDVLVDGVSVGAKESYTFENVTANHTISATFERKSDGGSSSGGNHTSNTYYVRYHNDDDTVKDGKFIPGETVTVRGDIFTAPVGKVLAGWSLEENGKVDYKIGDTFRMSGSSVDLYAVWENAETESHSAYISGYPDGTVGPDKTITRAEAATMFYNLLADKTGDAKTFTDVPANQWYAKAVMTLAGKGVISGYPDGTFKPDASITRAEFVTMAMNFANAEKGTACSFPDVPQNMWYYGAIAGATQNGWISGYPDGTFGPDRYITRAEVTSVINRMENRAADMSFMMDHLDELRTFSDLGFGHWAYASMMEAANGHDYTRADQNSYEAWVDIH